MSQSSTPATAKLPPQSPHQPSALAVAHIAKSLDSDHNTIQMCSSQSHFAAEGNCHASKSNNNNNKTSQNATSHDDSCPKPTPLTTPVPVGIPAQASVLSPPSQLSHVLKTNTQDLQSSLRSHFLLVKTPTPRAYRVPRVLLEQIPYFAQILSIRALTTTTSTASVRENAGGHNGDNDEQKAGHTAIQFPIDKINPASLVLLLKLVDHHLAQPYPVVELPVTPRFVETLHPFDLNMMTLAPDAVLLEVAMTATFLGLVALHNMIIAFLSLKLGSLELEALRSKVFEMNGSYHVPSTSVGVETDVAAAAGSNAPVDSAGILNAL